MGSWYRITNRADAAEIHLYDEIGAFGTSAKDFVADLGNLKASQISLRINSPGGEVFDGIAIYNALKNHPARVEVTIDGLAASAASFVAMAGDRVTMTRNAQVMIHEGHAIGVGNSADMRKLADLLDRCSDNIADIYAQRAGGTVEDWRARMREETWFNAAEAVKAGLADAVEGKSEPSNSWDLTMFTFPGRDKAPDPFASTPRVVVNLDPGNDPVADALISSIAKHVEPPSEPDPDSPPDGAGFSLPDIRGALEALDEIKWDPDLFKAAVTVVALDSPAVPVPAPSVPEQPEPELSINLPDLRRAIREGHL